MQRFSKGLMVLATAILLSACAGSGKARKAKRAIDGDWLLQTITTEGIQGRVSARLFNEASFNCFVGSAWTFIANNTTGSYRINNSGNECSAVNRLFRWTLLSSGADSTRFQFKRMDDDHKELDNGNGYILQVTSISDTLLQMKSNFSFEGKPAAYIFNYVKNKSL